MSIHLEALGQVFILQARFGPEAEVEGVHHQEVLHGEGPAVHIMQVCRDRAVCVGGEDRGGEGGAWVRGGTERGGGYLSPCSTHARISKGITDW